MNPQRRILVTSALPYANGPLHLGYLLEAIQTDIWVRFQRLRGHECHYVCADDTHGTPIMLKAQAEGISAEQLIARVNVEHRRDLADMLIALDNFGSTHDSENRDLCERIYLALRAAGFIDRRTVRQAYDAEANMFLPDRYVKGTCPNCGTPDQYGDSCEVCGATYSPADLKNPVSTVSGTTPVERESEHYFFRLSAFDAMLRDLDPGGSGAGERRAQARGVVLARACRTGTSRAMRPISASRSPAPRASTSTSGSMRRSATWRASRQLCGRTGLKFDDFFAAGAATELHHFIGKDILYFHTLFWPAVLQGAGMRRPSAVHAHGFVTINGQKMSKSRGTFITARRYLDSFSPEYLRYYFAAKLGPGIEDLDMNLDEFAARLNSDLVGKLVNIASRCAGFITRTAGGRLADSLADGELFAAFAAAGEPIAAAYESRDYASAIRDIMALADRANQYIDQRKPWILAKQPQNAAEVQDVCTLGLNLFRALMIYLAPVLPGHGRQVRTVLRRDGLELERCRQAPARHRDPALRGPGHAPRCRGGGRPDRTGRHGSARSRRSSRNSRCPGGRRRGSVSRADLDRRICPRGPAGRENTVRRADTGCGQAAPPALGPG